ncbi:ComF family protein [Patescibacteria group bacterium]|nr:MAG: ComF family protein [Patescibacteria group bacterium]
MEALRQLYEILLDFLFPKSKDVLRLEQFSERGELFKLPLAIGSPSSFITPLFDYRDRLVRNLVWAIKYRGNRTLTCAAATLLYEAMVEELGDQSLFESGAVLLVPVPISSERRRERGFNQAELLCGSIKACDTENFLRYEKNTLKKVRDTAPQTSLKRSARLKNLSKCFATENQDELSGATVILIDDVATTGSTLKEARRVLKESGARKVIAFTIAH